MAKNFMFAPASLTVKAGSTVTWTNQDDEPHTYHYACSIHPRMVGTIVCDRSIAVRAREGARPDARRAFWAIKHGIKMSAMPAWAQ